MISSLNQSCSIKFLIFALKKEKLSNTTINRILFLILSQIRDFYSSQSHLDWEVLRLRLGLEHDKEEPSNLAQLQRERSQRSWGLLLIESFDLVQI